jgi:hypothetical protein
MTLALPPGIRFEMLSPPPPPIPTPTFATSSANDSAEQPPSSSGTSVSLPIKAPTLEVVLRYCAAVASASSSAFPSSAHMQSVSQPLLPGDAQAVVEVMLAAFYLDIPGLVSLCAQRIAVQYEELDEGRCCKSNATHAFSSFVIWFGPTFCCGCDVCGISGLVLVPARFIDRNCHSLLHPLFACGRLVTAQLRRLAAADCAVVAGPMGRRAQK